MQSYTLPRTGAAPLTFRGELIVEQLFTSVYVMEFYIDADGRPRAGNSVLKVTIGLYRTEDGGFAYHAHGRHVPPLWPEHATGRKETAREHRRSLRHLEDLQRGDLFKPGPMRFAAS